MIEIYKIIAMKKTIPFFLLLIVSSVISYAQDGVLDNTFGSFGRTLTNVNNGDDEARNVVIQPDDKIVIGGFTDGGSGDDFLLTRYNANGTIDNTFGTNGIVVTHVSDGNDVIRGLALQTDGKIVAVGYAGIVNEYLSIIRYNADGTIDNSFATNGMDSLLIFDNVGSDRTVPNDVKIQSDGKIVVAGFAKNSGGDLNCMVVRYNTNGTLDASFGIGGKMVTSLGNTDAEWEEIAIQADGNIVACGHYVTGSNVTMAMARYNQFGLDNSFGSGGIISKAIGQGENKFLSLAIQPDTKIVVGGVTPNGNDLDFVVLRYISDGTIDNTFGTAGAVITELGTNVDDYLTQIKLQPDGKILACGTSFNSTNDFAMVRYNSGGSLDNSFGISANGIVKGNHGGINEIAFGIDLQSDGKIILAGAFNFDVFVDRYNNTIVGVEEVEEELSINVYPNPASHYLFVDTKTFALKRIEVLSIDGRVLLHIENSNKINVASLPVGTYVLKVTNDSAISYYQKFIKK